MTRVRLLVRLNPGDGTREALDVIDVSSEVADALVAGGQAERLATRVERAVKPEPENTATQARGRKRTRAGSPIERR